MTFDRISRRTALALASAVLASRWFGGKAIAADGGQTHIVEIRDFVFAPERIEVRPGDRITWINRDIAPHTATADDGSWDSGELRRDEEWQMTVEAGMKTDYYCRFHPMMKARLAILQS